MSEDNPEPSSHVCPSCGSDHTVKNGSTHHGKPKRLCRNCGRQFVNSPTQKIVSQSERQLIDRLLLERISLRGIVRVTGVSWSWLQEYVNKKLSAVPRQIKVSEKSKGKLIIECDEVWSFVGKKKKQFYIWLAIDRQTREIVGCYIGNRTYRSCEKLWQSLPPVYRQCAVAYSSFITLGRGKRTWFYNIHKIIQRV